jgi:hypothetical protein
MGARLQYAKIIDQELFLAKGGKVHPSLENRLLIRDEPGPVRTFWVFRAWVDDHGTFSEQWRIESPGGSVVYESTPREVYLATETHVERLEDEVADLHLEYAADDYNVVFRLDDREVARIAFPVEQDASHVPDRS